jgi:4,5-DOPA dioxygenase extradiol
MNTLERNRFTDAWRGLRPLVGRPRAILAVSAHWYVPALAVTAMARPRTIHDFAGFPDELFAVDYPAPGDPELAADVAALLAPRPVVADREEWGLDHGTWSVLAHLFPEADVPVVQLSVHARRDVDFHLEIGRALAPLRAQDVLVLASGNVVHNLRKMDWSQPSGGFAWAERFDADVQAVMTKSPDRLGELTGHADFALAAPTPDHFLPLAHLAGLADAANELPQVVVDGPVFGSLTMTSFAVGLPPPAPSAAGEAPRGDR